MPHGRGHRRVHSYFSGFTAVEVDQPIHKAVSSNSLHVKLQTTSGLIKAKSAEDVCGSVKARDYPQLHTDLEVQALKRQRKDSFVTVPSFVKHSVKQLIEPMARPRSPKSKNGGECSHQQIEDKLDQTLLAIRQQLNDLSNERMKMEQQMDDLINGIQEARQQYRNQQRRRSSGRILTPISLRRMSSAGAAVSNENVGQRRAKQHVSPESPKSIGNDVPDAPHLTTTSISIISTSVTSQESIEDSPVFTHKGSLSESLDSSVSTHSLPAYRSKRSQSTSSSAKDRVNSDSFSEYSRSQSLSQDEWIHSSVIPELPESPKVGELPPSLQSKYNQSTPALHYQSSTAPRSKGGYKTSTPNSSMSVHMMTSSPDISKKSTAKQEHYSHHSLTRSQRNSLPDSVMNSIILEDQVDNNSCYDSLSQLSSCTDEGSPKSKGSTLILRRSSLTGQLEHIRRPRLLVKRNSSFGTSSDKHKPTERSRCESSCSLRDSSCEQGFKVLTRGYRKSAKRKPKKTHVILPSVETTV